MKKILFSVCVMSALAVNAQWSCGDTLVDSRDGKRYVTIPYGSDCWMAENLNYGQFTTSDSLGVVHHDQFNDSIVMKYCQGNDSMNCISYGGLYEWNELMNYSSSNNHGICPPGWHVATDAEWQSMIATTGGTFSTSTNRGTGANDLKALGEGLGADTGTNASGFAARAHGDRDGWGVFTGFHMRSIFWTSTPSSFMPYQYTLWAENDTIYRYSDAGMESGFSCRCVMDAAAGVGEINRSMIYTVYPDPATDHFNIHVPGNTAEIPYSVYDAAGKLVLTGIMTTADISVSTDGLQPGYYIVSLAVDGMVANKKLVIVR